ncbi:MAG: multidrug efflux SMR transporter [Akkermansia sp.]
MQLKPQNGSVRNPATNKKTLDDNMSWLYLLLAGCFEMGWPIGLKLSQAPQSSTNKTILWIAVSVICMTISGFFLWMAQRHIPIGTAYAVWTGIGAVGTFIIGISFFGDHVNVWKLVSVTFLIMGIIGLKIAH